MKLMNIINRGILALSAEECDKITSALDDGTMRRFGAIVNHVKAGYSVNALIAWKVDETRADAFGERFAALKFASHVYLRESTLDWPYSLYTMVHAHNDEEMVRNLAEMDCIAGNIDRVILKTRREYKKTSLSQG